MNLELLKTDIEAVASKVLGREVKVTLGDVLDSEGDETEGIEVDGWIVLYPVTKLQPTIARVVEIEQVAIDRLFGGDDQFEEPDVVRVGEFGEADAIVEVITLLARQSAEGHLEAIGEARYIEEMEAAEKELEALDA